ncbi:MAG: hypothetical protein BMS9Abin25_0521 [Gammaproteobacteria bacterium]|nr:MAG: hypothetical protein BMS9Abin25_0521 [Gammaproteobacteria bacterium]
MISEQAAVGGLYQSLIDMGKLGSNPVLAILPEPDRFKQGLKYPAGNLNFSGMGLRAYYHNHARPYIRENEHGHFHIFITDDSSQSSKLWQHLAALSVDSMGQAQSWFCVNNWVTGGKWLPAERAKSDLLKLFQQDTEQLIPVERWIFYMLAVYFSRLLDLLEARDSMIESLISRGSPEKLFNDRSIYDLAEIPVDLLADLTLLVESN